MDTSGEINLDFDYQALTAIWLLLHHPPSQVCNPTIGGSNQWLYILPSTIINTKATVEASLVPLTSSLYSIRLFDLLRDLPIKMLVSMQDMKLIEELIPRTIVKGEGIIVGIGDTKKDFAR